MPLSDGRVSAGDPWVSSWSRGSAGGRASGPTYASRRQADPAGPRSVGRLLLVGDVLVACALLLSALGLVVGFWDEGGWVALPVAVVAGVVRLLVRRRPAVWVLLTTIVAARAVGYMVYGNYSVEQGYAGSGGTAIAVGVVVMLAVVLALVLAGGRRAAVTDGPVLDRQVLAGAVLLCSAVAWVVDAVVFDENVGAQLALLALVVPALLVGWAGDRAERGRWIGARGAVLGVALVLAVRSAVYGAPIGFVELGVLAVAVVLVVVAAVVARRPAPAAAGDAGSPFAERL